MSGPAQSCKSRSRGALSLIASTIALLDSGADHGKSRKRKANLQTCTSLKCQSFGVRWAEGERSASSILGNGLQENLAVAFHFSLSHSANIGHGGQGIGAMNRHLAQGPVVENDIGRNIL